MKKVFVFLLLLILAAQTLPTGHLFQKETFSIALVDDDSAACEKADLKKDVKEFFCTATVPALKRNAVSTHCYQDPVSLDYIVLSSPTPPPDATI